jgi:hypothetical protein
MLCGNNIKIWKLACWAVVCSGAPQAFATVTFFTSSGDDVNGDLLFQSSVSSLVEEDFNGYANGGVVTDLVLNGITIDVSLPNEGIDEGQVFFGSYAPAGGVYGTVSGGALASFAQSTADHQLQLDFSTPESVQGFGLWVFDDGVSFPGSFTMTVIDGNGASFTSPVIDGNPGSATHAVDGFLGAATKDGIQRVTITQLEGLTAFEVDHFQLATQTSVPEPGVAVLALLSGLALLGRRR